MVINDGSDEKIFGEKLEAKGLSRLGIWLMLVEWYC